MSGIQNWSSVVRQVEKANLEEDMLEKQIKRSNKRAYKQQLDREVEQKHMQNEIRSAQKQRELQEVRMLAETEKRAKQLQKHQSTQLYRQYEIDNSSLLHFQQNLKTTTKQFDNQHIKNFLQHPFVKLVDNQDTRIKNLKQKFIKQNEINHIQQEIRNRERNQIRYREWQERNTFVDHVEQSHAKRSQEREKFKIKYLKIKKQEDPTNRFALSPESVEKTYINYLNQQINQNNQRRREQKQQVIDPKINQFYGSNKLEPDSSPAFLGRNPLSHQRKRQLYYINKHLNTNHERSYTAMFEKESNWQNDRKDENRRSSDYVKLSKILNPEESYGFMANENDDRKRLIYHPFRNEQNQSESVHLRSHPGIYREKVQTEAKQRKSALNEIGLSHSVRTEHHQPFQTDRPMRSQFMEHSLMNDSKLPQINKKLQETTNNSVRVNIPTISQQQRVQSMKRPHRRQFFIYDPIIGKQTSMYV